MASDIVKRSDATNGLSTVEQGGTFTPLLTVAASRKNVAADTTSLS